MGSHVSTPATSGAVAQECVVAFLEMEKDATNNDKLVEFVRSHYVSRLNAADFCSLLQRRQASNDHSFIHDLSTLYIAHSTMEKTLKSKDQSFCKQLRSIGVSKKASAVLFTAAAVICAAAAAANANANTKRASLLFGAVGKWVHSVLNKRERVVRRNKEVTELMIMGAKVGMKDVDSIHTVAQSLLEGSFSFQDLLDKIDYYGGEMKWVKQLVLQSITKHLD